MYATQEIEEFSPKTLPLNVSVFEKTTHFARIGDFELVLSSKRAIDELHVALYFASIAASVLEIRLHEVQNYDCTGFEKTANECSLPVFTTLFRILTVFQLVAKWPTGRAKYRDMMLIEAS